VKIKELVKKLEGFQEYKGWKKENYASSLVHIFKMFDEANKDEWQIGFYNSDDTITTFIIGNECIRMIPKAEIFKEPNTKIQKLDIDGVKIELDDALGKARKFQEKEYPNEKPIKEIVILQNLDIGQLYNITLVTRAFNTLNMKVDAKTGKIVKHQLVSLMDLEAK